MTLSKKTVKRATRAVLTIIGVIGVAALIGVPIATQAQAPGASSANFDWPLHNLDARNSRYAPIDDVNRANVSKLMTRWSFMPSGGDNISRATPLVIDGVMYFNSGSKLYALNAVTGQQLWVVEVEPP